MKTLAESTLLKTIAVVIALAASPTTAQAGPAERVLSAEQQEQSVSLSGGVSLELAPMTRLQRMPGTELVLSASGQRVSTHVLLLEQGRVQVTLAPSGQGPGRAVMVRTAGSQIAVVKSGRAVVMLKDGGLVVANLEGETLTGSTQGLKPLAAGVILLTATKTRGARTVTRLPAPAFQPGPRLAIWIGDRVQPIRLRWDGIPGANGYRVEIRAADGTAAPRTIRLDEPEAVLGDASLAAGDHLVTVRAVDEFGLDGAASYGERIAMTSVLLPNGAYVDERGRMRMAPGQTMAFSRSEALEISRAGVFHWLPAPGSIGMDQVAVTRMFVRAKGSSIGIPFELAPREIVADVQMAPGKPVWPRDPVRITVRVRDETGRTPAWVQPIASVTLGLKPVSTVWERKGDVMKAVIPGQAGSGPVVVRVEVRDQFGLFLGRNFLEIDRHM